MTATHVQNSTMPTVPVLYFSLELGSKNWKLAFTVGGLRVSSFFLTPGTGGVTLVSWDAYHVLLVKGSSTTR